MLSDTYGSIDELRKDLDRLDDKPSAFKDLIGYNGSLSYAIEQCKSAITYPEGGLSMILLGATGVGKSLLAEKTYQYGVEKGVFKPDSRFVTINCSEYANNPELFLVNFFGNVKGAYTGADQDRDGLVKLADGGMLFLDEVQSLCPECQENLYLFMDKGTYHKVGDNEKWYQSKVFIAFATTEDPKHTLLKPLLRRIPIICRIPTVAQRPDNEKKELLYTLFNIESERINITIEVNKYVYHLLSNFNFIGNVGDMENCVKVSVASALAERSDKNQNSIKIDYHNLPSYVILESAKTKGINEYHDTGEYISLEELKEIVVKEKSLYLFNEKVIGYYLALNQDNNFEQFIEVVRDLLTRYVETITFQIDNRDSVKEIMYQNILEHIRARLSQRYRMVFTNAQIINLSRLLADFINNYQACDRLLIEKKQVIEDLVEKIKVKDPINYALSQEILDILNTQVNLDFGLLGELDFYLYFRIIQNTRKSAQTVAIVLAHGYSTASSMTTTANYMLGSHVFDAIDVPIDISAIEVAKQLSDHIKSLENTKNLLILVDMGSLEEIHKNIVVNRNMDIVLFNNVTMKLVLDVGMMILNDLSSYNIIEKVKNQDYRSKHIYIESKERKNAIITVCPRDLTTAHKFKQLLLDSLPKKVNVEIISYSFEDLYENKENSQLFEQYEVKYIVGTVNPKVDGYDFIPIEELVGKQNLDKIKMLFDKELNASELEAFGHNILRNFSLQNLVEYLTILNPEKVISNTEVVIQEIKRNIMPDLDSRKIVGLYIHISCLIERLLTDRVIGTLDNIDEFVQDNQEFIRKMKRSFMNLENNYTVEIPVSEIAYIYDYIYKG